MTDEQIKKANDLKAMIKKYEEFIWVIDPYRTNSPQCSGIVNVLFQITTKKFVKMIGFRHFGIGQHEQEIVMPIELIQQVSDMAFNKLESLKSELDAL